MTALFQRLLEHPTRNAAERQVKTCLNDQMVCPYVPFGTHVLWHILNAGVLAFMVIVLHRANPEPSRSGVELG